MKTIDEIVDEIGQLFNPELTGGQVREAKLNTKAELEKLKTRWQDEARLDELKSAAVPGYFWWNGKDKNIKVEDRIAELEAKVRGEDEG